MSTFDSTKLGLQSLITDITTGRLQLPDFQRGWVWNDEHVRSLLVSIAGLSQWVQSCCWKAAAR